VTEDALLDQIIAAYLASHPVPPTTRSTVVIGLDRLIGNYSNDHGRKVISRMFPQFATELSQIKGIANRQTILPLPIIVENANNLPRQRSFSYRQRKYDDSI
jgi:hypothetical protein